MSLIRPFAALRPQSSHTAAVIAPPYDVLNSEEARQRAEGRPWSFLPFNSTIGICNFNQITLI
ncbi:Uncharacterized conserved protein UCP033563, partial [Candidatus Thiomargarita nelsonii]